MIGTERSKNTGKKTLTEYVDWVPAKPDNKAQSYKTTRLQEPIQIEHLFPRRQVRLFASQYSRLLQLRFGYLQRGPDYGYTATVYQSSTSYTATAAPSRPKLHLLTKRNIF